MLGNVRKRLSFAILGILSVPSFCFAEFWITEIHFNPQGSDSGYEWIEVRNDSGSSKSLEGYVFREGGTNHGLKVHRGSFAVPAGEFVVIADKPDKFLTAFPNYSGTIMDSAFSLNNTGEKLELLDSEKNIRFEVTYSADTAKGDDGSSIGLVQDIWTRILASPGEFNTKAVVTNDAEEEDDEDAEEEETDKEKTEQTNTDNTQTDKQEEATQEPNNHSPQTYVHLKNPDYKEKLIKVDAGADRTVMAGADYQFTGQVFGLTGEEMDDPEVYWNWGDGSTGSGVTALHTYLYPGTYTAVMRAKAQKHTARDYMNVTVIAPSVLISAVDIERQTVSLENVSDYVLELSGYQIHERISGKTFSFPEDSFIVGKQTITVPLGETMDLGMDSELVFRYPKGEPLSEYSVRTETKETIAKELQALEEQAALLTMEENASMRINEPTDSDITPKESTREPSNGGVTYAVVYQQADIPIDTDSSELTENDGAAIALASIGQTENQTSDLPINNNSGQITITDDQSAAVGNSFVVDNSPFFYLQVVMIILVLMATSGILYLRHRSDQNKSDLEKEADDVTLV